MSTNIFQSLAGFVVGRVDIAEKIFKHHPEFQTSQEEYDQCYQEILEILSKTGQQQLLVNLKNAQYEHANWILQAVYLQACMDVYTLFNKD